FRKRRNRRCEYGALAQAETFPTEKAEKLVFDRSATEGGSELILSERWALNPGLIGKKFVRVQNFVAQEFVRGTVPLVGSRFGAEVDDPPGELAPVRPKIVVLDLKFRNRILGRKNERQIDMGVTTFRRRSICRPDAGVPGLFGCGRANTDRSRR